MSVFDVAKGFISCNYKESVEAIKNLIEGFNYFNSHEVVVGIPEDTNVEREEGISNAELLYLHEQGIPSHNVPPRPVLKPAIAQEKVQEQIEKLMHDGAKASLVFGNKEAARKSFEKAGMVGRDACKKYITDGNNLAPNAPSTIAWKGSSKPLIDTGSMLNSITYAVRKKKAR